jgi:hypothetical protein
MVDVDVLLGSGKTAALDDPKASADVTAIKNVSLDLLGVIGARLCQDRPKEDRESPLKSLQEVSVYHANRGSFGPIPLMETRNGRR